MTFVLSLAWSQFRFFCNLQLSEPNFNTLNTLKDWILDKTQQRKLENKYIQTPIDCRSFPFSWLSFYNVIIIIQIGIRLDLISDLEF